MAARITQTILESIIQPNPNIRVSQTIFETILGPPPPIPVSVQGVNFGETIPTAVGDIVPLAGDRSAWDVANGDLHASDIYEDSPYHHVPKPSVSGHIPISNGTRWEAKFIDDYALYILADGTRILTADWDIGDGRKILADAIWARDGAGLGLYDDAGDGIFVADGGAVRVQPGTDSVTAFQVNQADTTNVLTVDTANKAFQITGATSLIADIATSVPLIVKGAASQSANLQEWQDSGGGVDLAITSDGDIKTDRWLNQDSNTFIGVNVVGAGNLTHTAGSEGWFNTIIGDRAGYSLTTGYRNVAVGVLCLNATTTGIYNVALGDSALRANTIGNSNFGLGYSSLRQNISGINNIAVGTSSLHQNTSGNQNVGLGGSTLRYNQTGDTNVAIGHLAGQGVSGNSFDDNVLIGASSGFSLTTGSSNVFIGYQSGYRQNINSNLLIIDNQQRADAATEITNSILYGVMAAAPANQTLRINASVLVTDKVQFTQTDGNEYIDSLTDGYMDYGATTAHRFNANIEVADAKDIALDTTTGTKLATATGQKLGFWNATPVVQQVLATGGGATVDNVISVLQTLGLCKQA